MFKFKVAIGLISPEFSLPGLQIEAFFLGPHIAFLCVFTPGVFTFSSKDTSPIY